MLVRRDHDDGEALASHLAQSVAADLGAAIDQDGRASLAVSGGSTPVKFFQALSAHDEIDWSKVTVTLVDERWVDADSDRSNARLVRRNLLQHGAAEARFVPLFADGAEPDDAAIARVNAALRDVPHPFAAVVLGMGNDGHTASFFPGGDKLGAALSDEGPAIAIKAPGAGEARVTVTLPYLLGTGALYLHIEGAEKAATLARALDKGQVDQMPIRAVLRQSAKPVTVFWCP